MQRGAPARAPSVAPGANGVGASVGEPAKVPPPSERTKVRRMAARGAYDRDSVYGVLDAGFVCHVGFNDGEGRPAMIPTLYWRDGDWLYIHGKRGGHMLKHLYTGADMCVCVTHVDGFVLARAQAHHSANYRSVCIFGKGQEVTDEEAAGFGPAFRARVLRGFVACMIPGRDECSREGSKAEITDTGIVRISLAEASAKVRTGGPGDDRADYALNIWAGVIPMALVSLPPVVDPLLRAGIGEPACVSNFDRVPKIMDVARACGADAAQAARIAELEAELHNARTMVRLLPVFFAVLVAVIVFTLLHYGDCSAYDALDAVVKHATGAPTGDGGTGGAAKGTGGRGRSGKF